MSLSKNENGMSMADCLNESSPFEALLSVSAVSESIAVAVANDLSSSIMSSEKHTKQSMKATRQSRLLQNNRNSDSNSEDRKEQEKSGTKNENEKDEKDHYPIALPSSLQFTGPSKLRHHLNITNSENPADNDSNSTALVNSNMYANSSNSAIETSLVCSESILASLSKIARGGSKASTEMRKLEDQRYVYEKEAMDVSNALKLREFSQLAASAMAAQRYKEAAVNIQSFRNILASSRAKEWAGKSTLRQYARTEDVLKRAVMDKYEQAVMQGNLDSLSELTPLLGMLELAGDGVALYLKYSRDALFKAFEAKSAAPDLTNSQNPNSMSNVSSESHKRLTRRQQLELQQQQKQQQQLQKAEEDQLCNKLARVFNAGVTHLRHHLPMVASSLGDADGDAGLVQLVYLEVEKLAIEYWKAFAKDKNYSMLETKAARVTARIEEKYVNGMGLELEDEDDLENEGSGGGQIAGTGVSSSTLALSYYEEEDDCGFKGAFGSLGDLDKIMDETALALQHTESFERFIRHAIDQVLKARELRLTKKRNELRWKQEQLEDEKQSPDEDVNEKGVEEKQDEKVNEESAIKILPTHTELNETVAEIGGYYSGVERALQLASMQRAFLNSEKSNDQYSPIGIMASSSANNSLPHSLQTSPQKRNPLQTSIVEECLYAAQRSTMRAFATGHSGTACAAANFCSDSLGRVLLEVLIRRAEDSTASLKPGEGLLEGSGGLGQAALSVINSGQKRLKRAGKGKVEEKNTNLDSAETKHKIFIEISRACAHYNDLEVAAVYTKRLETQFLEEIDSTFPPGNLTEQLRMCVKSLTPVNESFQNASKRCIEQLVIQILPRVRSIADDAVGYEGTATAAFMTNTVIGKGANAVSSIKMNYDLDDEAYELSEISEGYMRKMCSCLDDLLDSLRMQLVPHLSDAVVLGAIGGASKRVESALRRSRFTALGALSLDADIRYFVNYAKERLDSPEYASSVVLYAACNPLARLSQIALLMNVDDLEDVLDLISSSKRKGNWDLKLDDAKSLLNLREDFEGRKVNELLQISESED